MAPAASSSKRGADAGDSVTTKDDVATVGGASAAATEPRMDESDAPAKSADEQAAEVADGKVTVVLAHPLDDEQTLRRLRIDPAEGPFRVGDPVRMYPAEAQAVINAGYAQVNPKDQDAVREIIRPTRPAADA
jgi:hypothetical protein